MKIREIVTLCENSPQCTCIFCERHRRVMAKIPRISDEEALRYGRIADKMHKQLFIKPVEPSWSELKKLKL